MTLKLWSLFCLTFSIHYRFILENLRVILILFLLLFNLIYSAFCYLRLFLREYECPFIFRVYSTFSSDIVMLWMKKKLYVYSDLKKWNKPDCNGCRYVLLWWSSGSALLSIFQSIKLYLCFVLFVFYCSICAAFAKQQ